MPRPAAQQSKDDHNMYNTTLAWALASISAFVDFGVSTSVADLTVSLTLGYFRKSYLAA